MQLPDLVSDFASSTATQDGGVFSQGTFPFHLVLQETAVKAQQRIILLESSDFCVDGLPGGLSSLRQPPSEALPLL